MNWDGHGSTVCNQFKIQTHSPRLAYTDITNHAHEIHQLHTHAQLLGSHSSKKKKYYDLATHPPCCFCEGLLFELISAQVFSSFMVGSFSMVSCQQVVRLSMVMLTSSSMPLSFVVHIHLFCAHIKRHAGVVYALAVVAQGR